MKINADSSAQIKRTVVQLLETIHLIENSKNSETVIGRFDFLLKTVPILELYNGESDYLEVLKDGLRLYIKAYPDRTSSDIAFAILEQPNITLYKEFYCISLYNSLGKQFQDYINILKTIKQESAKLKRKETILETIGTIKNEIKQKCQEASSFQKINEAINKLEDLIKNRTSFDDLTLAKQ